MILMIAGGILLAFLLLPFLGPIVMVLLSVGVIIFLAYGVITGVVGGKMLFDSAGKAAKSASEAKKNSFGERTKHEEDFYTAYNEIDELAELKQLRKSITGRWQLLVLHDRIDNCRKTGAFRVEDQLNRRHLEDYLDKVVSRGEPSARAETLRRDILLRHDHLTRRYEAYLKSRNKPAA